MRRKKGVFLWRGEKMLRYQEIEVQYQDVNFKQQRQTYSGWIAQIIQHEIDHCRGILI